MKKELKNISNTIKTLNSLLNKNKIEKNNFGAIYAAFVDDCGPNCWPSRILQKQDDETIELIIREIGEKWESIIDQFVKNPNLVIKELSKEKISAVVMYIDFAADICPENAIFETI